MKNWINELLSDGSKVSSRRLIAIVSLLLIIFSVIGHSLGLSINSEIFYTLAGLCATSAGLTIFNKRNNY